MSEREEHNELIHQLAERLRNHTVPYKDGAWEHFRATYGKRRRRLWPYWSAAAVLLAAVCSYWFMRQSGETRVPLQMAQQNVVPQAVEVAPVVPADPEGSAVYHADAEEQRPYAAAQIPVVTQATDREEVVVEDTEVDNSSTPEAEPQRLAVAEKPEAERSALDQPVDGTPPGLVFDGSSSTAPDTYAGTSPKSDSDMEKWDLGVVVSPSLTSERVNIGGGLAVAYRISDKFSIGSGISIAQLGLGENPNYQPNYGHRQPNALPTESSYFNGKSEDAVDYKREVSLTSSVVTLDIPLDIRYEVAKGFYTSVGVSYVAILNEHRTGHYVDKINTNTFTNGNQTSADRLVPTEFVYTSEKIAEKPLRGNGYAGFMNFSIGKKLPISKTLSLSVEPYFKLPIGRLSKEEMDFTNGGIRIVTGF